MALTDSSFFDWLMEMLRSIAGVRTPFMNTVMSGVTLLGQETITIVLAVVILYCFSKRSGYKFLFMFLTGTLINQGLKCIFMIPRPWVLDPDFEIVESARAGATGWSFPSGHTQSAVMAYGGIAHEIKKKWAYIVAAVLIVVIGFSRMYLGVHTFFDVIVAIAAGVFAIALADILFRKFGDDPKFPSVIMGVASALALAFLIVIMVTDKSELRDDNFGTAAMVFGLSFGVFCGSIIERRFINFETKAVWWVQIIKVVLGLGIIIGLRMGLKPLFKLIYDSPIMNAPRYFLMTFIGVAVYPISFKFFNALDRKKKAEQE
ncbi:MAG: phosphatase PAP2 family protein [Clostridia bacterium]|nr:phosphatase PAP2 family protein [Clostridia bacterium]